MSRDVRYHPLFECDVIAAANWYDECSPGLGDAFAANARLATEAVIADPERHPPTSLGLRYYRVARFPYYVLYDLADHELLMLGVLHTSRSVGKRLKTRE